MPGPLSAYLNSVEKMSDWSRRSHVFQCFNVDRWSFIDFAQNLIYSQIFLQDPLLLWFTPFLKLCKSIPRVCLYITHNQHKLQWSNILIFLRLNTNVLFYIRQYHNKIILIEYSHWNNKMCNLSGNRGTKKAGVKTFLLYVLSTGSTQTK